VLLCRHGVAGRVPLIACPDCHRQISDAAPACIHCGRPAAPAPPPADPLATATARRHPLAGPAETGIAPRAVFRGLAAAAVIGLVGVRWAYGGRSEALDLLLAALVPIALGASLLLMPLPPAAPARTAGARRRGKWGEWFTEQDARRESGWNVLAGWVLLLVGAVTLIAFML
ncbi:MAG TPA: hypothetical protein VFY65_04910, partial [Longimicrobium sp.]|nr:hypothetical protein [Longimicrobium sp.]